jgi:hypothetical protein
VNANPQRFRKLLLGEADETAQCRDIAWLKVARRDALSLRSRESSTQFFSR